jgi:hypothetical protein
MIFLLVNTVTDKLEVVDCRDIDHAVSICIDTVYSVVSFLGRYKVEEVCAAFDEYVAKGVQQHIPFDKGYAQNCRILRVGDTIQCVEDKPKLTPLRDILH